MVSVTNDLIGIKISADGARGLLLTREGEQPFTARLFADNQWHSVPLLNQTISQLPVAIAWSWEEIAPTWLAIKASITNQGLAPVRLGSFHMMEGRHLGKEVSDPVVFLDSGGEGFAGAVKGRQSCPPFFEKWTSHFMAEEDIDWAKAEMGGNLEAGAHHSLAGLMVYYRATGLSAWMLSFLVPMERCSASPILLIDPRSGGVRAYALVNNFAGYELLPGESINTETILLGRFGAPHQALETWADTCARIRRLKVWPRPPVGWLSWYGYHLKQNETETLRTADLIKNEFAGLGFEYLQLDLGYNRGNLPGDWFETNENYPHGLKHMVEQLAQRGFKLGVWVCPVLVAAECEFARKHPDALMTHHPQDPTRWFWEPRCHFFYLDPTHPEGEKFLRQTVRHFKSLGIKYFKFDFIHRAGRVDRFFSPHDKRKVKGVEIYRHAQKIIMAELDQDDYVYWCSNVLFFGIGMGATSMVAGDIANTGFALGKIGNKSRLHYFGEQATTTMARYYLHAKMVRINADALNMAPPAGIEECRLRATLVAMSGGQMFLGDRFDLGENDRFEIIRQVTPPYGHAAKPVDLFEHVYPEAYPRIWHLAVDTGWDQRDLVALMNCEQDMAIEVDLARLGLSLDKNYYLWEFWEQKYIGKVKDKFSMPVKCPACRLVAIVAERSHPWVLATNFHFTQGGCDLAEVNWDEKRAVLSGVLQRSGNMRGALFITAPAGYRPLYDYTASLEEAGPGVYRYPISAAAQKTPWRIEFNQSMQGDRNDNRSLDVQEP